MVFCAHLIIAVVVLVPLAMAGAPVGTDPAGVSTTGLAAALALLMASVAMAWARGRPRAEFGLRPVALRTLALWPLAGLGIFWAASLPYTALTDPPAHDLDASVTAARGGVLIVLAILIVGLGPLAEETFWRGMVYRAVRARCRAAIAVPMAAIPFALLHLDPAGSTDQLPLLPPLILAAACLIPTIRARRAAPIPSQERTPAR